MPTAHEAMLDAATSLNALTTYIDEQYQADLARYQQLQNDLVGLMSQTFYVDQINGADANSGGAADPLQSIDEATERSVFGGLLVVILLNDYHVTGAISVKQGGFRVRSNPGAPANYSLTFANGVDGTVLQPRFKRLGGFAHIHFKNLDITLVPLAPEVNYRGIVDASGLVSVHVDGCEMFVEAGADMPLIQSTGNISLYVNNTIVPAAMAGLWVDGVAAGSIPANVDQVTSNITL